MATIQHTVTYDAVTGWPVESPFIPNDNELEKTVGKLQEFFSKAISPTVIGLASPTSDRFSDPIVNTYQEVSKQNRDRLLDWSNTDNKILELHIKFVRQLFEQAHSARDALVRDEMIERLLSSADVRSVLLVALAEFRKNGNADRLTLAASILENFGLEAIEPLKGLLRSGAQESEYFADAVINIADKLEFSDSGRDLIIEWTRHPVRNVRMSILESIDSLPLDLQATVTRNLSADTDDEISEYAKYLAHDRTMTH